MGCCTRAQAAYHIVSRASVTNVNEIAPPPTRAEGLPEPPDLPAINREIAVKREERAVAKAQAESATVNERVTCREQAIFSAMSKTMPCEWMNSAEQGQGILVMGAVRCAARAATPSPHSPARQLTERVVGPRWRRS